MATVTAPAERPAEGRGTLYEHQRHSHTPRSANERHAAERHARHARHIARAPERVRPVLGVVLAFNEWLAVRAYYVLGSMWFFYCCLLISFTGFPGVPGVTCTPQAFVAWLSSQTIQLAALPLLGAATIIIGRKQEIQSDEQFHATQHTLHDGEQMMQHLDAQDGELLHQTDLLTNLSRAQLAAQSQQHRVLLRMSEQLELLLARQQGVTPVTALGETAMAVLPADPTPADPTPARKTAKASKGKARKGA